MALLPWQNRLWHSILERKEKNCLPHALLFAGANGVGKKLFAQQVAAALLCRSPKSDGFACESCRSCSLFNAETHPDFLFVTPEENSNFIKIDQIRDVVEFVNTTALLDGYRVIIITPATAMNINAANALLKTLEEPTAKTLLILLADQSARLPATITSRCQKINFSKPSKEIALQWLQNQLPKHTEEELRLWLEIANGAPLQVIENIEQDFYALRHFLYENLMKIKQINPVSLSASLQDKNCLSILSLVLSWSKDLLQSKLISSNLMNQDFARELHQIQQSLSKEKILSFYDYVYSIFSKLINSLNLNKQLVLEDIFIRWQILCS